MADQGATFQIDLAVGGTSTVEKAAAALDALSEKLQTQQTKYKASQSSADAAAKALEKIGIAADAQRGKLQKAMDAGNLSGADKAAARLRTLVEQQSSMAVKAKAAKAALDQEASSFDRIKTKTEAAKKALGDLEKKEKAEEEAARKVAEANRNAGKTAGALGKIGGPLGSLGQKAFDAKHTFGELQEALGDSAPYAIAAVGTVAVVAAVVALSAAAVAGLASIASWAVGLADAGRSAEILNEGIAHSVSGGQALTTKINALANKLPLTTEELTSMADGLAKAGLRGDALTSTLEQNATAAAKLKFGPDFSKQMNSLTEQSKRLKLGVASIFGGLKIDKLLEQLSSITDMFSDEDAAGHGLKVLFETMFQPLIDGLTGIVPKGRSAFLQLEILALKAAIAIKPYTSKIVEVVKAFLILGAVIVGVVIVALAAMAAYTAVFVAGVVAAIEVSYKLYQAFFTAFTAVKNFLSSIDLSAIGTGIIEGLIGGITGAGPAVINALKGVVNGAIDSAKQALGIHSPSKVFAEIGMNTAAGMQQGIEGGSDNVQGALEGMTSPTQGAAAATQAASASSGSISSGGFNFQGAQFTFNGVKDADDAESRFGALLTKLIEGDVSQLGAAVPST